ncbi:hypothetical protein HII36_55195 [Nonomuraea sp. NN258]|nr:hypothetical protein [Nonomuraea antri]
MRVLGTWANTIERDEVSISDCRMTGAMVAAVGSIEIAVHGWDVARACGEHRPMPASMAEELLDLAGLFVTAADRPSRFAAPVPVPPSASPADRLLAFLGRRPTQCPRQK